MYILCDSFFLSSKIVYECHEHHKKTTSIWNKHPTSVTSTTKKQQVSGTTILRLSQATTKIQQVSGSRAPRGPCPPHKDQGRTAPPGNRAPKTPPGKKRERLRRLRVQGVPVQGEPWLRLQDDLGLRRGVAPSLFSHGQVSRPWHTPRGSDERDELWGVWTNWRLSKSCPLCPRRPGFPVYQRIRVPVLAK